MIINETYKEIVYTLTLSEDELRQIYRLMKNEIEGAECCDSTTHNMYHIIQTVLYRGK